MCDALINWRGWFIGALREVVTAHARWDGSQEKRAELPPASTAPPLHRSPRGKYEAPRSNDSASQRAAVNGDQRGARREAYMVRSVVWILESPPSRP